MENRLAGGGPGCGCWRGKPPRRDGPGWGRAVENPGGDGLDVAGLSTGEKGEPALNNSQSRAEFISILNPDSILIQSQ